jgi:hypothetical protein
VKLARPTQKAAKTGACKFDDTMLAGLERCLASSEQRRLLNKGGWAVKVTFGGSTFRLAKSVTNFGGLAKQPDTTRLHYTGEGIYIDGWRIRPKRQNCTAAAKTRYSEAHWSSLLSLALAEEGEVGLVAGRGREEVEMVVGQAF